MIPAKSWRTPGPAKRRKPALVLLLVVAALQWGFLAAEKSPRPAVAQTASRPNIVLIVTDDQRFDTLHVMPKVRRQLVARGMTFRRAIVTNPLCCPSRATILTGRFSHTTGVYRNIGSERWLARLPAVGIGHDRDRAAGGGVPDGADRQVPQRVSGRQGVCPAGLGSVVRVHDRLPAITTTPSMTIGWVASRTNGCRRITRPT